jgi:hypothetical protein
MATISFKVSPEEAVRIRRQARQEGRTVSEFIRRRTAGAGAPGLRAEDFRIVRSRKTGLPVMIGPPGSARVTSQDVRARLTDFP